MWVQIDEQVSYFGESRGEVITYGMNIWFRGHAKEIQEERARIEALRPKVNAFVRRHRGQIEREHTRRK